LHQISNPLKGIEPKQAKFRRLGAEIHQQRQFQERGGSLLGDAV
jgi:hypothetical protein